MPEQADELLADLVDRIDALAVRDFSALEAVVQRADMILRRVFGEESEYRSKLQRIHFSPMVAPTPDEAKIRSWNSGVSTMRTLITTAIEERELFGVTAPDPDLEAIDAVAAEGKQPTVFIVHGHDELTKTKLSNFIRDLGCRPVILHEQPSKGRTIIEKFEQESAPASFAVVLLTGDDQGAANGADLQKRARQNVVFELGYFVGVLKRARVAALVEEGVETPGDYDGVIWIGLSGEWKLELAKEMKHAGLPIDLNDAI